MQKAKEGDKDAFSEIILEIKKELYYLSKAKLNSEDDIADCIQDTIIISYQNIKKLKKIVILKLGL